MNFLISLPIFLIAVCVHECAHGWAAYKLGDPTAKQAGRLTLNPLVHIDPMGTIMLPILLVLMRSPIVFGWAKPVPVNFGNLRRPRQDMVWVGLAGPAANILLAIILSLLLKLGVFAPYSLGNAFLVTGILINLVLAVFNIMPIPPLDGSKILAGLLPREYARLYSRLEPYGFIILIALLWIGVIDKVIWPLVVYLARLLAVA